MRSTIDKKNNIKLSIVNTEATLFSDTVTFIFATGRLGELGIAPGHTPLITALKPGQVRARLTDGKEELFYVSGGTLEVQPNSVTVLADTAIRAAELDEAAAREAREEAEKALADRRDDFDYSSALAQLAEAVAKLQTIQQFRHLRKLRK